MWLCLNCNQESEPGNYQTCPKCGSDGIPVDLEGMLTMRISRHELRILVIWAERWAMQADNDEMRRVVYGIADRLETQDVAAGPLTLVGEINQLRDAFPSLETNIPDPPESPGLAD